MRVDNLLSQMSEKLSMVAGEIFAERKNREEDYDNLIKRIGGHILRINNQLLQEKKQREETHEDFMQVLDGVYNRMMGLVD